MNLTHFKGCKDISEVKSTYRQLCKDNHPDVNPNVDVKVIQDINAQYTFINKNYVSYPIGLPRQQESPKQHFSNVWETMNNFANAVNRANDNAKNNDNRTYWYKDNVYWSEAEDHFNKQAHDNFKKAKDEALKEQIRREQEQKIKDAQEKQRKAAEEKAKKQENDYFLANKIVKAFDTAKSKGYKPVSVYYRFLDYVNKNGLIANLSHFELIAEGCGYKSGWARFKYEEYMQELSKQNSNKQ